MDLVLDTVSQFLSKRVPPLAANTIIKQLNCPASTPVGSLDVVMLRELTSQIETGLKTFAGKAGPGMGIELRKLLTSGLPASARKERIVVRNDSDVLTCQRTCQRLTRGFFSVSDATRLITAVSELARNIYTYAGTGEVTLSLSEEKQGITFRVVAQDQGPGIANLDTILSGNYTSKTGLGRGILGTRALLDTFDIQTKIGRGTTVTGSKVARAR